jgi:hypothetical protein
MVVVEGLKPVMCLVQPMCSSFEQIRRATGSKSSLLPTLGADFRCVARAKPDEINARGSGRLLSGLCRRHS